MGNLVLRNVNKSFQKTEVLKHVDFEVQNGEFVVIVGPSGCGKSTLLRIIAGLETQTNGEILIGDKDVSLLPPARRGISMVFQSYALYPHLSVEGNMTLGLKQARTPKALIAERVAEAARILELGPYLSRRPAQLSGGQRQRVAIGRAITRHPEVFLFDEPLSNLDAALRNQVRVEIADLHKRLGATMVYVTHDQIEAMTLADRIVVMNGGVVQQMGTPAELYRTPRNLFVAGFIGTPKINMLTGAFAEKRCSLNGIGELAVPTSYQGAGTLAFRPAEVKLLDAEIEANFPAKIVGMEYLGNVTYIRVALSNGTVVVVEEKPDHRWALGQDVHATIAPSGLHLFDAAGNRID
jgi:multiple sugar transport system ATP-binding protein